MGHLKVVPAVTAALHNLGPVLYRVVCPNFGHPALGLEFKSYELNTEFVAAVEILCLVRNSWILSLELRTKHRISTAATNSTRKP